MFIFIAYYFIVILVHKFTDRIMEFCLDYVSFWAEFWRNCVIPCKWILSLGRNSVSVELHGTEIHMFRGIPLYVEFRFRRIPRSFTEFRDKLQWNSRGKLRQNSVLRKSAGHPTAIFFQPLISLDWKLDLASDIVRE